MEVRILNYDMWLEKAKKQIYNLPSGYVFFLKDLFQGIEWKTLEKGHKLSFGRFFKNEVTSGKISDVSFLGKAVNNSSQYIKK